MANSQFLQITLAKAIFGMGKVGNLSWTAEASYQTFPGSNGGNIATKAVDLYNAASGMILSGELYIVARTTDRKTHPPIPVIVLSLLRVMPLCPVLGEVESSSAPATLQRIGWQIGAEVYGFKYEESIMDEEGVFYGLNLAGIYRPWVPASQNESLTQGGAMFGLEGRIAFGKVDYDGALDTGEPLAVDDIDDYSLETRAIFGTDWIATDTMHTVYAGIGYRYLNDDLAVHPAGYERESNYVYLPLGYQFDASLNAGWSWAARLEYDLFLWGRQRSHLSDAAPELPDVDNRQESGFGYRVSIRLQHKCPDGVITIEPFFRFWDIEDSRISLGFFEPANETAEYGIQLVWAF